MTAEPAFEILWAPSAERDLGRIYEYLRRESPRRAATMASRVVRAVDQLATEPLLGPVAPDVFPVGRCRHLVVAPLRVSYQVHDQRVHVLRIWDSRRDPASLRVASAQEGEDE